MVLDLDDDSPVSRLENPLSLNDVMKKCPEFSIRTDDDVEREEETDIAQVYDYHKLEPYTLLDILEPAEDYEDDNPSRSFPVYRKQMDCVTDDAKIMKKLEKCGLGDVVGESEKIVVYIHYAAYSEFNEYPFDVSRLRQKKPYVYRLGIDSLVVGLELAIRTMKKGEKSKFLVHPDLAFGAKGVPPRIPANATILYDVELIDFTVNDAITLRLSNDDEDERPKENFDEALKHAQQLRNHGNKQKKLEKNVNAAISAYRKALRLLIEFHYQNEEEEKQGRMEMLKLYTNLSVCYMQKKDYKRVCIMYNDAHHDCPGIAKTSDKLLYNSAKALRFLKNYTEASKRMKLAHKLNPHDPDISRELKNLEIEKSNHDAAERRMCQKMMGFIKNKPKDNDDEDDEKIIEQLIDQVNEEFRELFIGEINTFVESEEDSVKLAFGATPVEKEFCRSICKMKKLSFRELQADGTTKFIITKRT